MAGMRTVSQQRQLAVKDKWWVTIGGRVALTSTSQIPALKVMRGIMDMIAVGPEGIYPDKTGKPRPRREELKYGKRKLNDHKSI